MRILHIAPFNTAGVPFAFVKAERALGHESRLVTLGRHPQDREEDICLDLPFLDSWLVRRVKGIVTPEHRRVVSHVARLPSKIPPEWKPSPWGESLLINLRERVWKKKIEEAIQEHGLYDYDVYQLDGGLEFFRDGRFVRRLKESGKKVICCYTGSDLRTRGVIPAIDASSDLNVTVEFDHLQYHPDIHHVPFPLDVDAFQPADPAGGHVVRIGHAPTNRAAKGSDIIIPIVQALERRFPVQLVLIEGLPYSEAIRLKRTCHVFIDQIGDLGYGMNSLEALAMGIPACSSLAPGFAEVYPDHPFIVVGADTLETELTALIQDRRLIRKKGKQGRAWVRRVHDARAVVERIHSLAGCR